ncbi:phosphate-starvation-inducible protein PsiE [Alkalihalobacillus sp. BA299]|uniref:phosphate-starvation-inducible protein PsiE n=1 Tax=Alkalihalobacillus sp. BA299 TaxID=2815938 RepID=UPI001AD977F0|nr:phosphate-starvation-inducible protein PsiE [Alkalihalobacillus sp. BA299]
MSKKGEIFSVSKVFQFFLNVSLILLCVFLCVLLLKELYHFGVVIVLSKNETHLLEDVLLFFLYFEFISMIVKYFRDNYHFPLRYFIYIGITAMTRIIIVDHTDPINTLFYAFVILILILGYFIINYTPLSRPKG